MSEEVPNAEVTPAPEAEVTATPVEAPASGESKPDESGKPERVFTQAELDEIVGKRIAKEQRKAQREADRRIAEAMQHRQPEAPQAQQTGAPRPDDFKTADGSIDSEAYIGARARYEAEQLFQQAEIRRQQQEIARRTQQERQQLAQTWNDKIEEASEKYEDYFDVVHNPSLPVTDVMAEAIMHADNGPEISYFLGKNPKEAARIAGLSPFLQAKEIGRLETKLSSAPPPKKISAAPEPIRPITGGGSTIPVDTTDPKSLSRLGTSAWIEAERKRQIAKLERQLR